MSCHLDTRWTYNGLKVIRIENRRIALDILSERGGNIYRLIDKANDSDLLWKNPRVRPHRAPLQSDFDDHWAGGWDEAFPGGAPSRDRYGSLLPYMGEIWSQPTEVVILDASPRRCRLRLISYTPITTARFEKTITVDGDDPIIRLKYRITNTGTMDFDFNWGIHPSLAIAPSHRFDIPATRGEVDEAGGGAVGETGDCYDWPNLRGVDLRQAKPESTCAHALHYLTGLTEGWWAATDTANRRGFGIAFDLEVFPVVWFVAGYGGFRGFYQVLVEPWTGYPTALADAREAGRSQLLTPGESFATQATAVVYSGVDSVTRVSTDGSVEGGRGRDQ